MKTSPFRKFLVYKILISVLLLLVLLSSCRQYMEKDEAMSHLKAFDNEIVGLLKNLFETKSYRSLDYITSIPDAPIPYIFHKSESPGAAFMYDFKNVKGIYNLDTISNTFIKTAVSDSVIINYYSPELNNAKTQLIIAQFKEEPTNSAFLFPTEIDMVLLIEDKTVMNIDHIAEIEYGIPTKLDFIGAFDNYKIKSSINTKLRKKRGRLKFETYIFNSKENVFSWVLRAGLGFEENISYNLRKVRMDVSMFPVKINIRVNNHKIPSITNDYVTEFNKNSNIRIHSAIKNKIVGRVELRTKEHSDKLDYAVRFKDDSYVYIEDLLISARNILNIKL